MSLIDPSQFPEPGLYLVWPDGNRLALTRPRIETEVRAMLDNPASIPPHVKAAADYQPCDICPMRDTAEICHSIMTALPFMDEIDRYMSYDRVTAVFREENGAILHVIETTMQEALKYVSILGVTHYCEVGKKYGQYFHGVDPLMEPPELAAAVYRNIFFVARGDMQRVEQIVRTMQDEIIHTVKCQTRRLRLISKRDAFLNAFVAAHTTTEFLFMELRHRLREELTHATAPPQRPF